MVKILLVSRQLNNTLIVLAEHLFNQNYQVEILTSKDANLSAQQTFVPIRTYFKYWSWIEASFLAKEFFFQPPNIIHFFDFGQSCQIDNSFKFLASMGKIKKSILSYSFLEQNYKKIPKEANFFRSFSSISFPSSTYVNEFRKQQQLKANTQIYYLPYFFSLDKNSHNTTEKQKIATNHLTQQDKIKILKLLTLRSPYWLAYLDSEQQSAFVNSNIVNILQLGQRTLNDSLSNSFYLPEDEENLEVYVSYSQKVIIKNSNLSNYKTSLILSYCQKHEIPFEIDPSLNPLLWSLNQKDPQSFIDEVLNKQTRIYENALN